MPNYWMCLAERFWSLPLDSLTKVEDLWMKNVALNRMDRADSEAAYEKSGEATPAAIKRAGEKFT